MTKSKRRESSATIREPVLENDARLYERRGYTSVMGLPQWPTLAQWRKERRRIRRHLRVCAGLNARTGAFKARGRVVSRFAHEELMVENICIETLPGFFMVGNLYRPQTARGRLPLILHPHGHAPNARTTVYEQSSMPHRAMNSALLGFAAFAYSMIGYDDDAGAIDHRTLLQGPEKRTANLLGLSMFGLQLNNSIKALDYLLSRPDIDPQRVGCTGESGGGTQTYFLAALDERVKVVAPAVMLSDHMQGGCVCENAPALHLRYSNLHYAGLIAPRPMLLLGCTGDWTHHMRERELPAMQKLYRIYGREGAIDGFYQDANHNYNRASREAVYAWMVRWLQAGGCPGKPRIPESSKPVPSRSQLLVFDAAVAPYKRAIRDKDALIGMWRDLHKQPGAIRDVADMLQLELPEQADLLIRGQTPRKVYRKTRDAWHYIKYGRFSQDSQLLCRFVLPKQEMGRSVLVLKQYRTASKWEKTTDRLLKQLRPMIDAGWGVLAPRLFGASGSEQVDAFRKDAASYLASSYNKTAHQHQLDDIVTTLCMARTELKVKPQSINLVADADIGLLALAGWSWLRSKQMIGELVADLGGADLRDPATWARQAYLPLVCGVGGVAGLARLSGGGKGVVSGVRAADRGLLPKGLRVTTAGKSLV